MRAFLLLAVVFCVVGAQPPAPLQCFVSVGAEQGGGHCVLLDEERIACLEDAVATSVPPPSGFSLGSRRLLQMTDGGLGSSNPASGLVCASFFMKCPSCFQSGVAVETFPCADDGQPACSPENVQENRQIPRFSILTNEQCLALKTNPAFSQVECCTTSGCNLSPVIPYTSFPPQNPGSGPCERAYMSWPHLIDIQADAHQPGQSFTGALGMLMTESNEVWICMNAPDLPEFCGGGVMAIPALGMTEEGQNFTDILGSERLAANETIDGSEYGYGGSSQPPPRNAGGTAGQGPHPPMPCYTYNEKTELFAYWGKNTDLMLVNEHRARRRM